MSKNLIIKTRLDPDLNDWFSALEIAKGNALSQAIKNAWDNPTVLVEAFARTVHQGDAPVSSRERAQINIYTSPVVKEMLDSLALLTQLGREHTLHLCANAYRHAQLTQGSSHGPLEHLLGNEGRSPLA